MHDKEKEKEFFENFALHHGMAIRFGNTDMEKYRNNDFVSTVIRTKYRHQ